MRKSIHIKDYDYTREGYYFVTVCTNYREKLFCPRTSEKYGKIHSDIQPGNISVGTIENTDLLEKNIMDIEKRIGAEVDFYCIMPDHIHMIIHIIARQECATTGLPWMINAFKGWCTKGFRRKIFQPNYFEHVIRTEKALSRIREYILNNPFSESIDFDEIYADIQV